MPIYEFCAENVTYLEKAFQAGAQRVELCDNLAVGGTTPSYGVIKAAVELAKDYQAKVIVMIRPRGGDFVYSQQELAIMLEDIKCARELGVDGFALGALTSENQLDTKALKTLLDAGRGLGARDESSRVSCGCSGPLPPRLGGPPSSSSSAAGRIRTSSRAFSVAFCAG